MVAASEVVIRQVETWRRESHCAYCWLFRVSVRGYRLQIEVELTDEEAAALSFIGRGLIETRLREKLDARLAELVAVL